MSTQISASWPGWQVDQLLGTGSFGSVYRISRSVLGSTERSALKVITIPNSPSEVDRLRHQGFDDASIVAHFRACAQDIVSEYAMMMKMKGHPNIVYCDDYRMESRPNGMGWEVSIKMELLTPLLQILPTHYSESLTVHMGRDLCNALMLCEKRNIIHRDIKPENVFYSDSGDFKLGDFGVAKYADRVAFGTRIGTFDYMAPEVYAGRPYGFVADQYALGMVLYWAMNNWRIPFLPAGSIPTDADRERAWARRAGGEPIPLPANGSPALKAVVMRACAYEPSARFPGVEELLQALQQVEVAPFRSDRMPGDIGLYRAPASLEDL